MADKDKEKRIKLKMNVNRVKEGKLSRHALIVNFNLELRNYSNILA